LWTWAPKGIEPSLIRGKQTYMHLNTVSIHNKMVMVHINTNL